MHLVCTQQLQPNAVQITILLCRVKKGHLRARCEQVLNNKQKFVSVPLQATRCYLSPSMNIVVSNGADVIPWDSAPINSGGHYDLSLHAYVAPVDGYYQ